jgi:hypothetical protein
VVGNVMGNVMWNERRVTRGEDCSEFLARARGNEKIGAPTAISGLHPNRESNSTTRSRKNEAPDPSWGPALGYGSRQDQPPAAAGAGAAPVAPSVVGAGEPPPAVRFARATLPPFTASAMSS